MKSRKSYELEKIEITKAVSKVMNELVDKSFANLDSNSVNFMKKLYDGRIKRASNGGRLRDIITKISLNYCNVKKLTLDHYKIIAAGELYNMASYYQNWHLDDKKEVKTENDKKMCHIASHIFRELAEKTILETSFEDKIKLKLLLELSETNEAIQIGQSFELNFLNNINLKKINEKNIEDFYKKRTYLFGGRFFSFSFAIGSIITNQSEQTIKIFKEIGSLFGTGAQMINDVGDFCLNMDVAKSPEKDYQDQFADLEKGTITFVIWSLSKFVDVNKYIGRKITNREKENLLKLMVEKRCFDSTRKTTNSYRNKCIKLLNELKYSEDIDNLKMIVKTFFNANKFYVNLRDEHKYDWNIIT